MNRSQLCAKLEKFTFFRRSSSSGRSRERAEALGICRKARRKLVAYQERSVGSIYMLFTPSTLGYLTWILTRIFVNHMK